MRRTTIALAAAVFALAGCGGGDDGGTDDPGAPGLSNVETEPADTGSGATTPEDDGSDY